MGTSGGVLYNIVVDGSLETRAEAEKGVEVATQGVVTIRIRITAPPMGHALVLTFCRDFPACPMPNLLSAPL